MNRLFCIYHTIYYIFLAIYDTIRKIIKNYKVDIKKQDKVDIKREI